MNTSWRYWDPPTKNSTNWNEMTAECGLDNTALKDVAAKNG